MSSRPVVHAEGMVNRPYADVREALFAGPLQVFRHATTAGADGWHVGGVALRAKAGPLSLGKEVALEVLAIEDARTSEGTPGERFVLRWKAVQRPALYPEMRATLTIRPVGPSETLLDLDGTYDPPLGWLGDALDAVAMRRIAQDSVTGFVSDVAAYLRDPQARPAT